LLQSKGLKKANICFQIEWNRLASIFIAIKVVFFFFLMYFDLLITHFERYWNQKIKNMKNPTYLQKQYTKLTKKLNKAFSTGRFYEYTQYKQQQLLDKFTSYTLQLKKLGMVAAVGAAVAMATPVLGQVPFAHRTGLDNPIDTFKSDFNTFVDIDGDGDLDVVGTMEGYNYLAKPNYYYENVGTATSPDFLERTPIFSDTTLHWVKFVDIDADGDLDCFMSAGAYDYSTYTYSADGMKYYENTGTATSHNFILRNGNMNPLDSLNYHTGRYAQSSVSFGDLDGDGDMDAFYPSPVPPYRRVYYENIGTATNPVFLKNDAANPFTTSNVNSFTQGGGLFYDQDRDGDLDYMAPHGADFYRNTGTPTVPSYTLVPHAQGPYSQIVQDSVKMGIQLVDINGDGDLDIFGTGAFNFTLVRGYYENIALPSSMNITTSSTELDLQIYPNPTTGIINLEAPLTGNLEIFNTLGQVLQTKQLEEEQQLNLNDFENGTYFIKIQTSEGILQEKVVLQR